MNHALIHTPYPIEYPLSSEQEYLVQGRAFSSTSSLSTNLSSPLRHTARTSNVNPPLASPLTVPSHNGFGYAAQQSPLQDTT
ncbi:hypothetical protein GJ744_004162 [Endocarpon pusillum]|uniref:Uncharacterized protein n=1 Tax=Endocarpon pusillum TaxID=364733 RepID=A0A8H7ANS9_9EURO|nr:hypothetical protein GJ744_004162 [Endocarpon pusillum]